jgi:exodeoxyribonuclease VII large subunit
LAKKKMLNQPTDVYSVTGVTTYIRTLLEGDLVLQDVWITGEISNMTKAASGHWYFTLKDPQAQLKCVMFKREVQKQLIEPQNGSLVNLHGRLSVYETRGEYQLYADELQPVGGIGDLYLQFERLKAQLAAEGLFDEARKRPIPATPRQIGVVTSPDAAAFRDVQNALTRRYPLVQVILSPTQVQGQDAPPQIVRAIERLNEHTQVDVILLCRGGGSLEDLWCFNDERVARAIAASRIPIISGVGHEVDFTIADFVADVRASTPTAAAELATPDSAQLREQLQARTAQLTVALQERVDDARDDLVLLQRTLGRASPARTIRDDRQRLDEITLRMQHGRQRYLALQRERLAARTAALAAANPAAILARGYAIVTRSDNGKPLTHAQDAPVGTGVTIQLHEGELKARIEDKDSHDRYKRTLF